METYDETMEYTRQAKRDFAAVGRAWFFYFAVSLAAAFLSSFVAGIVGGEWLESDWGLYMVGLVIPYLFAFPVFFLLIRRKAAPGTFSPEKKKLSFRSLLKWFCIAQFLISCPGPSIFFPCRKTLVSVLQIPVICMDRKQGWTA